MGACLHPLAPSHLKAS